MTTQAVQSPATEIEAKSTPPLSPARRGFLASAAAGIAAATAGATASADDKFHQNRDWTGNHPVTYPEPAFEERAAAGREPKRRGAVDEFDELRGTESVQLADRDRALVRHIVATTLRRLGTIRHLLNEQLDRGLPKEAPRTETALLIGATTLSTWAWVSMPGGPSSSAK